MFGLGWLTQNLAQVSLATQNPKPAGQILGLAYA